MRTILAATLIAAVALPAIAQEAPRRGMTLPSTRAEAQERAKARFVRLDRNQDGTVTSDELPGQMAGGDAIGRLDGNGDGKLSAAEFEARALGLFDQQDADHDGRLSDDERKSWRARAGMSPRAE
jgi:Ca2+-binding EF-hand superfamily protein